MSQVFRILIYLAISAVMAAFSTANAQLYSSAELEAEAPRLKAVVQKIYALGFKPKLTPDEIEALGAFEFVFPSPRPGDDPLNFAATTDGRQLIMPLMSLQMLEDMTTAYAWLHHNGMSLSTIDLYFAMLRYRDKAKFPGGKPPKILDALGVPKDAYKTSKKVDEMSLSLRNEAIAFVIAHELGHIRFRHKPLNQLTAREAVRDEEEADRFGLELLRRTGTPPFGPMLFFQAQVYGLLHRQEFSSEDKWQDYLKRSMTHPLTLDRMKAMAVFIRDQLPQLRPTEREIWQFIGTQFLANADIMADVELARCIVRIAGDADLAILKPRQGVEVAEIRSRCKGISAE
jgi:hypothetical protein